MAKIKDNASSDNTLRYLQFDSKGESKLTDTVSTKKGTMSFPVRLLSQMSTPRRWLSKVDAKLAPLTGRCKIIKIEGQKILLKVNEIAEILGTEASEVKSEVKSYDKKALETSRLVYHMKREAIASHEFAELESKTNQQITKHPFTAKELKKTVSQAVHILQTLSTQPGFSPDEMVAEFESGRYTFYAKKGAMGNLEITWVNHLLGRGGFGEAYKVTPLDSGTSRAFKMGRTEFVDNETVRQNYAKTDVLNEYLMLTDMNKKNNIWGIQGKPKHLVSVIKTKIVKGQVKILKNTQGIARQTVGIMGEVYEGDYHNTRPQNLKAMLIGMHQILHGWKFLCDKHIVHNDIKPQNILVKGEYAHLADMGGARMFSKEITEDIFHTGACTKGYHSPEDARGLYLLKETYRAEIDPNKREEFLSEGERIQHAYDGFGIGMSLYQGMAHLLGNKQLSPYPQDEHRNIDFTKKIYPLHLTKKFMQENYPNIPLQHKSPELTVLSETVDEINEIIKSLVQKHYNDRMTADVAIARLTKLIDKFDPRLNAEIQQKITDYQRPHVDKEPGAEAMAEAEESIAAPNFHVSESESGSVVAPKIHDAVD